MMVFEFPPCLSFDRDTRKVKEGILPKSFSLKSSDNHFVGGVTYQESNCGILN